MFLPYEKFQLCYLSSRQESSFTEEFIYFVFVPVLCHCSTDCLCLFFNKSHYKNLPLHLDPLFHLTACIRHTFPKARDLPTLLQNMFWRDSHKHNLFCRRVRVVMLYRYHHGGGSSEFSLFSSLSFGFKYPVRAVRVLL